MVASGRLKATQDGASVIANADISLICVGTPSAADGGQNLNYLRNVAIEIGRGLRHGSGYHVVVVRSTLFPGTTRGTLRELLEEHSGRRAGVDFGLASNPEFMRETSAINDFLNPPYTVIGEFDQRSGDRVRELYQGIDVPIYRVALEEAEVLKMTNNAFHAVKVGFANEIGRVCARLGIDSHVVMGMVCADTKLNISPAYLKPGFAIGGSCLPKDLRSLTLTARRLGVELPILEGILPSNRLQIEEARIKVHELDVKRVAVLGLSFKAGTDDLRESPVVDLIRALWQDGIDTLVCDPDIDLKHHAGQQSRIPGTPVAADQGHIASRYRGHSAAVPGRGGEPEPSRIRQSAAGLERERRGHRSGAYEQGTVVAGNNEISRTFLVVRPDCVD